MKNTNSKLTQFSSKLFLRKLHLLMLLALTITFNSLKAQVPSSVDFSPTGGEICGSITLTASVSGCSSYQYQWQQSSYYSGYAWANISGANGSTYIANAPGCGTLNIKLLVKCTSGSSWVVSNEYAFTAGTTPYICLDLEGSYQVNQYVPLSLAVDVCGANNVTYQWQSSVSGCGSGFSNITGATSLTYNVITNTVGTKYYRVRVSTSSQCSYADYSSCAIVTVTSTPFITTQPTDKVVCSSGSTTLSVAASCSGTMTYQWQESSTANGNYYNVTSGSGATTATYSPTTATEGVKYYKCRVTCSVGSLVAFSNPASVTVNSGIPITSQPTGAIYVVGSSATALSVTGTSSSTINYQWQSGSSFSGPFSNISGATSSTYTPSTSSAGITYYRVVLTSTGTCQPSISTVVTIEVVNNGGTANTRTLDVPDSVIICYGETKQVCVEMPCADSVKFISYFSKGGTWCDIKVTGKSGEYYAFSSDLLDCSGKGSSPYYSASTMGFGELSGTTYGTSVCLNITHDDATNKNFNFTFKVASKCATTSRSEPSGGGSFNISGGKGGSGTDTSADIKVRFAGITITSQPIDRAICQGGSGCVSVTANNNSGSVDVQWQMAYGPDVPFIDINGATSSTYCPPTTTSGIRYFRAYLSDMSDNGCVEISDTAFFGVIPKPNAGTDKSGCFNGSQSLGTAPSGQEWSYWSRNIDGVNTPGIPTVNSTTGAVSGLDTTISFQFILTETFTLCSDTVKVTDICALPVELVGIWATWKEKDGYITWATSSEKNNFGYFVERSINGKDFEEIGFVNSKGINGNSYILLNYEFFDKDAYNLNTKLYYYRLKQVDFDGAMHYSPIVDLNKKSLNKLNVKIFPNPSKGNINVSIKGSTDQEFDIQILDIQGRVVYSTNIKNNEAIEGIDLNGLSSGVYFLNIHSEKINQTERIIISK